MDEYVVDFPTLWVVADWIEAHCIVPDGFHMGQPFVMYDWQLWSTANHYRVKPEAEFGQLATAFHYRRSLVVAPQKTGKGPWSATLILAEAVGPVVFAGWANGGEIYDCAAHGCDCGWWYEYEPGEPMGIPWPSPLIQLTATSVDQTDNVYRPLQSMVKNGPLSGIMPKVGEEFIRLPGGGRIDVVTSSALARLGNPVTFVLQDESGLYNETNKMRRVAETQRRGAAGMGGRVIETTNPWDPAEDSVAQRSYESSVTDVFRFYREPPRHLSYKNKEERRKIHRFAYQGSDHVDLDAIEAEAVELMEKDPGQAERFFGNRIVYGHGQWLDLDAWDARRRPKAISDGTQIVLGMDGSDVSDWTAIRAETEDGYQFTPRFRDGTPMIWNPAEFGRKVPRLQVGAAVEELFLRYDVVRFYVDPPYWETECDEWADRFGDKIVLRFETYRPVQMHAALERLHTDVHKSDSPFHHDGCETTRTHIQNARKDPRPSERYVLGKPSPGQKIDACMSSVVCHEAWGDATAAGLWLKTFGFYAA